MACVPKEFIQALSCEPDERIRVNVTDGAGPELLSAAWLLTSTTGGISGRVRAHADETRRDPGRRRPDHDRGAGRSPNDDGGREETRRAMQA